MWLRVLGSGDFLDYPSGPNMISKVLIRERMGNPREKVAMWQAREARVWIMFGRGHKTSRWPLEDATGKDPDSPLRASRRNEHCQYFVNPSNWFWPSDLQNCKLICLRACVCVCVCVSVCVFQETRFVVICSSSSRRLICQIWLFLLNMRVKCQFHITKTQKRKSWVLGKGAGVWANREQREELGVLGTGPKKDWSDMCLTPWSALPWATPSDFLIQGVPDLPLSPCKYPELAIRKKQRRKLSRPVLCKKQMTDSPLDWQRWSLLTF